MDANATFKNRFEQTKGHKIPFVALNDNEQQHYKGSGWCLVQVGDDGVETIRYLYDIPEGELFDLVNAMIADSNTYFAMASGYTLCEPRFVSIGDSTLIPRIARLWGEEISD